MLAERLPSLSKDVAEALLRQAGEVGRLVTGLTNLVKR